MSKNGISHLQYKAERQAAKLALASADRAASGRRSTLDISELPAVYAPGDNDTSHRVDNPNPGGLVIGRPWTSALSTSLTPDVTNVDEGSTVNFTFHDAAISDGTTLYYWTGGNINATHLVDTGQGSFVVNSGTATISITVTSDHSTAGYQQSFYLIVGTGWLTGTIIESSTVLINDTSQGVVTNGLQVHLQTQQTDTYNGSSWTDATGNGYDAIMHNIPGYQGSIGQPAGTITDGVTSGSYIEIPYNLPSGDAGWTVSIQAALNPSAYWATIFGNESWNAHQGFVAYLVTNHNMRLTRGGSAGSYMTIPTVSQYTAQIFDFVKQPFGGQLEIWIDGVQIGTIGDPNASWTEATNNLFLGARHNNNGVGPKDYCPGVWWNVRIYNRALSSSEIQQNYNVIQAGGS